MWNDAAWSCCGLTRSVRRTAQVAGKFPLKLRDTAIAAGIALLKTKGLIPLNDSSDDDVNYAEAAGVEW